MSISFAYDIMRERALAGEEGMFITVVHKGKIFGVTMAPEVTERLLKLNCDPPEGEGIQLHNFLQQYFTPALHHLKQGLEGL